MNRQEDFDRQADDYSNCCFEEDDSLFAAFHFREGAEYGYQYAVEKACEFIQKTLGTDFMVERFKQFMEE